MHGKCNFTGNDMDKFTFRTERYFRVILSYCELLFLKGNGHSPKLGGCWFPKLVQES